MYGQLYYTGNGVKNNEQNLTVAGQKTQKKPGRRTAGREIAV